MFLHGITLGTCFWNITNMNVHLVKSHLAGMTLHADKKIHGSIEHGLNTDRGLPVVKISNATIMHFSGTSIHLIISDSWIAVNTQDIVSPIFVMSSSTVEIYNCTFHGIQDMYDHGPGSVPVLRPGHPPGVQVNVSSVIFDVHEHSHITMSKCVFENIKPDLQYNMSAALYANNSHVVIYNSNFTRNTAYWAVIHVESSDVMIKDSGFSNNTGYEGASIHVQQNSSLEVHNSVFSNNTGHYGASITVAHNSSLEVHNSTFTHNSAKYGSGILAGLHSSVYVRDTVFSNNTGEEGSINVQMNSSLEVHNSTFTHNNGTHGSGISAFLKTSVLVTDCVFSHNTGDQGASIHVQQNCSLEVHYSKFNNNSALLGAAIVVSRNSSVSMTNCTLVGNYASDIGGAIFTRESRLYIETSTFDGNNAGNHGAVLYGRINVNVTFKYCTFLQNRAITGAVVYSPGNVRVEINQCILAMNTARQGSGFYLVNSHINILGTDFSQHYSNIIFAKSSHLDINACNFSMNFLQDSRLIQFDGRKAFIVRNTSFTENKMYGIIEAPRSSISLYRCRFADNLISWHGIINALKILLEDNTIYNNSIHGTSGIIFGNATIRRCTFKFNIKRDYGRHSLMRHLSKEPLSTLQVTQSSFIHNEGVIIDVEGAVDIVIDGSKFTENKPDMYGTISIFSNDVQLRTSNTAITAPIEGNKVAVYFRPREGINTPDYMTYNTQLLSGITMLNSSVTDTFLQDAETAGLIVIDKIHAPSYKVIQEETVFASGKYFRIILFKGSLRLKVCP